MLKHLFAKSAPIVLGLWSVAALPLSGCGTDELGTLQDELLAETKSAQIVQAETVGAKVGDQLATLVVGRVITAALPRCLELRVRRRGLHLGLLGQRVTVLRQRVRERHRRRQQPLLQQQRDEVGSRPLRTARVTATPQLGITVEQPVRVLSTILVGNNLVNTLIGAVSCRPVSRSTLCAP